MLSFVSPQVAPSLVAAAAAAPASDDAMERQLAQSLASDQQTAVFCVDRGATQHDAAPAPPGGAAGIMQLWGPHRQHGGVIGIGAGTTSAELKTAGGTDCTMRSCVVDTENLPWPYARLIRYILSVLVKSEGGGEQASPLCMLLIGGGGGQVAISIYASLPSVTVHVVEVDPVVAAVGRDFFGLWSSSDDRLSVFQSEGRAFVAGTKGYYDVIVVDAFTNRAGSMPLTLLTCQALDELRAAGNKEKSLVMSNLVSSDLREVASVCKTYEHVFGLGAVYLKEVGSSSGQYLLLAFAFGGDSAIERDPADLRRVIKALLGDKLFHSLRSPETLLYDKLRVGAVRGARISSGANALDTISDPGGECDQGGSRSGRKEN